ncbi:hypothetical protein [Streptomyces sp. NPDC003015]
MTLYSRARGISVPRLGRPLLKGALANLFTTDTDIAAHDWVVLPEDVANAYAKQHGPA